MINTQRYYTSEEYWNNGRQCCVRVTTGAAAQKMVPGDTPISWIFAASLAALAIGDRCLIFFS